MHSHFFQFELEFDYSLISAPNLLFQLVNLSLKLLANLKVFEILNPLENIPFRFLFQNVLVQHFVLRLQHLHFFFILQESLLHFKVLVLELGDQSTVHLTQCANAGFVSFYEAILSTLKQFL